MAFSVTINGHTYTDADFTPYGYVTAFPNIIARRRGRGRPASARISANINFAGDISPLADHGRPERLQPGRACDRGRRSARRAMHPCATSPACRAARTAG
jgi:hypothetical protein